MKKTRFRSPGAAAASRWESSIAAGWVTPWLKRAVVASRRTSHRQGGAAGAWFFFAVTYGLLYYAFYLLQTHGAGALLPAALR